MKLDAHTLYVVLISAYLLLGIAMLYTFRRPLEDGEDIWTASLFVGFAALVLLVTRNALPDLFSVVLANTLISAQYALQYLALCRYFKRHPYGMWLYAPGVLAMLAFSALPSTWEAGHILASGLIVGIQHIPMFLLVWEDRKAPGMATRHLLLIAIAANGGRFLFRAAAAFMSPESTPSIFGPIHADTLLLAPSYVILSTFAMVVMYRDRTEGRLRNSRQLLESIIEGTSDSIFTKDKEGRYGLLNKAGSRFMGLPRDRILGKDDTQVFSAAAATRIMASDRSIMISRSVVTSEELIEPTHGEQRIVHVVRGPVVDEAGEVAGIFGIARDITEHKHTEITLRSSEEKYRALVETTGTGYLILDAEGRVLDANPEYVRLTGRRELGEILGKPVTDWTAEYQREMNAQAIAQCVREGFIRNLTIDHVDALGRLIPVEINATAVASDDATRIIAICRDITDRKRAEAELITAKTAAETASLAKSRFLAAASHDLRQPMQAMSLFADAMAGTSLNAEQKHLIDHHLHSFQSLRSILDTLLDISKLDAGAVKATLETIQADTLIEEVDAAYSLSAVNKSLRFRLFSPPRKMAVITDGKLLMSLLENLVDNAIKYTELGGILVAIRRRGDHALIQVWDTGIGISEKHMGSIYEEYFQVENPERNRSKGLGFGLAIAKQIARLLETEVVCRSRPGKGSVFEFRLPLASPAEMEAPGRIGPPASTGEAKPAGRHVVLVEDDFMVATATTLALECSGMTVTRYRTAEEALADSRIAGADFYISDLRLPGLSGIEFLDAVQLRATKRIKAVVVTGDTTIKQIELMRSTPWQILFKPIGLQGLLTAIESQDSVH